MRTIHMQVEIYRDIGGLIIDGVILLPSDCLPREQDAAGHGVYEYEPSPNFWQLWHEDKQAMRDAGFEPYKDDYQNWCGRWHEARYEHLKQANRR